MQSHPQLAREEHLKWPLLLPLKELISISFNFPIFAWMLSLGIHAFYLISLIKPDLFG